MPVVKVALLINLLVCFPLSVTATPCTPLFVVKQHGQFGYIDRSAKVVIAPKFDKAADFSGKYARVEMNKKWGAINLKGDFANLAAVSLGLMKETKLA